MAWRRKRGMPWYLCALAACRIQAEKVPPPKGVVEKQEDAPKGKQKTPKGKAKVTPEKEEEEEEEEQKTTPPPKGRGKTPKGGIEPKNIIPEGEKRRGRPPSKKGK